MFNFFNVIYHAGWVQVLVFVSEGCFDFHLILMGWLISDLTLISFVMLVLVLVQGGVVVCWMQHVLHCKVSSLVGIRCSLISVILVVAASFGL